MRISNHDSKYALCRRVKTVLTSQTCLRRWSLVWTSHWPASLCILIDRPRSLTTATVGNTFAYTCRWSVFSPGFFCARRKSTNLEVFISAHRILYLPSSLPPLSAGALSCCKQVRHLSKMDLSRGRGATFQFFFFARVAQELLEFARNVRNTCILHWQDPWCRTSFQHLKSP